MDFTNSILKYLVLKPQSMIEHTPSEFLGTTKILQKMPESAEEGSCSRDPFLIKVSNCSLRISILYAFEEDVTTEVREERGGGFSNSR